MNPDTPFVETEVIALDFYDGATEGIAFAVRGCGNCYFKMIAWDQGQDERLYVVNEVVSSMYVQLLALLTRSQELPHVPVWLPEWKFQDDKDEQEANYIVSSCRQNLRLSKLLILGKDIKDASARTIAIDGQIVSEVIRVLEIDEPDDLANWLPRLTALGDQV